MATTVHLTSMADLKNYCLGLYADIGLDDELLKRLTVTYLVHDTRCGWDTHIIAIPGWGVLGFTDSYPS
jgi:hypothetical protein